MNVIMSSILLILTLAIFHATEADVPLRSCTISCEEDEHRAYLILDSEVTSPGAPGKRGPVGPKGDPGVRGQVGPQGIPGVACDCSKYDELATQVTTLQAQINDLTERSLHVMGWSKASNNCWYKLFNHEKVNYETAKSQCGLFGAKLAAAGLRTGELRSEIKGLLPDRIGNAWIGLDDLESHGHHVWSDGVNSTEENTDWATNQPGETEHCCVLHQEDSEGVHDYPCVSIFNYLCEV